MMLGYLEICNLRWDSECKNKDVEHVENGKSDWSELCGMQSYTLFYAFLY